MKEINLTTENGHNLCINDKYIKQYEEEILEFLDDQDYMHTELFAKHMMMSQEIKSNNAIEGINDDLTIIDEVIKQKRNHLPQYEKNRIINLYHGYQYILTHKEINKETLKELYSILSNGMLKEEDKSRMGEYYRTAPVYILKGNRLDVEPYTGINENKLDYFMNQYFEYVNTNEEETKMQSFIKSQIMHYYFVYIHPYFDVNGRTSRTLSMWYLIKNENYPYIIFNRAIAFAQKEYEETIIKCKNRSDVTLFIKYMITHVQTELEKEYLIYNINQKAGNILTKEDRQMIQYLLVTKGNITAKDLATRYNYYNSHQRLNVIFEEKINPLLEKGIILNKGNTKTFITKDVHNMNLALNKELIEIDKNKVKHLSLGKYL